MNNKKLVQLIVILIISLLTLLGLHISYFSRAEKKFIFSKVLLCYSIAVLSVFTLFYGEQFLYDYNANLIALKNVGKLHTYMNVAAVIASYISMVALVVPTIEFLQRVKLFELITYFEAGKKVFTTAATLVLTKTIAFQVAIGLVSVIRFYRNDANNKDDSLVRTLFLLLPSIIASLLPNCFFGAIVVSGLLFSILNERLQNIVNEVNCLQTDLQMKLQKPYYRMHRFCDLADNMDVLTEKFILICVDSIKYFDLVAVPFICSLVCNLFGITVGFFTQYLAIVETLVNEESYDAFNAITNSVFLVVSICDIALQAYMCNKSVMTVRNTSIILQHMNITHVDIRFKQSAETFSALLLVTKYKTEPLGFLQIDMSLVHDVLSAVTSFLLILIQSDLSLRFSLK
ncbi:putative gustatory receptor 94a [Teleopsis dalmanni]|uniref:putative gustatory receptor 94a n=1 Tax=Teleopsis dalmanni TaxID=139649 RepID=UPI0018CD3E7E|nr:putative gustatory receptor 94a [Teleopsis dalmanni]